MPIIKQLLVVAILIIVSYAIYARIILKEKDLVMNENAERSSLIGTLFPKINVQTLAKNEIVLPDFSFGKPTILCCVFDRFSQSKVDTWTGPILEKYPEGQVNYYEIPMISATFKMASGFIDNGMRGGVPKELHNNVATYYGPLNEYKTDLMMYDKTSCYLFLLDSKGIIQHIDESMATAQKLDSLFKAVENLSINK